MGYFLAKGLSGCGSMLRRIEKILYQTGFHEYHAALNPHFVAVGNQLLLRMVVVVVLLLLPPLPACLVFHWSYDCAYGSCPIATVFTLLVWYLVRASMYGCFPFFQ